VCLCAGERAKSVVVLMCAYETCERAKSVVVLLCESKKSVVVLICECINIGPSLELMV
jgi:hypothetical protein